MSANPSAIADVMRTLDDAISFAKPLPAPELIESMNTLVENISSPASENSLKDEIDQLGGYAVSIAYAFGEVALQFTNAIASGTSWDLKVKLSNSLATWLGHCVTFGRLILISANAAGDALDTANEFISTVLPVLTDNSLTLAAKKQRINSFLNKLDNNQARAQEMSQGFTNLKRDIDNFQKELEAMLNSYNLNDMEKRINQLDKDIQNLLKTLDELKKKVSDLTAALEVAKAAARATGILGFLCPIWWIGTAISAAAAAVTKQKLEQAKAERDAVMRDINNKQRERNNLQADLQAIPKLRSAFEKSTPDMEMISTRVGSFAQVWSAIRADTQAIAEKMDYAVGTDSEALFKTRVKTATAMYTALRDALSEYKQYLDASKELKEILERLGIQV